MHIFAKPARRVAIVLAAAFASLAASTPAAAQTWYPAGRTENAVTYVDVSNVKRVGSVTTIWQKILYNRVELDVKYSIVRRSYNCATETSQVLATAHYGPNDEFVGSKTYQSYEQKADMVIPGSIGYAIFTAICKTPSE